MQINICRGITRQRKSYSMTFASEIAFNYLYSWVSKCIKYDQRPEIASVIILYNVLSHGGCFIFSVDFCLVIREGRTAPRLWGRTN